MNYIQRIFVCVVLVFIFDKCVFTSKLSSIKSWPPRSKDMRETYNNCSGLKLLSDDLQPKYAQQTSFIRKCCPHGESYELAFDKEKDKQTRRCTENNLNFSVSVINALFYENCIEDNEEMQPLSYSYVNACTFNEDITGHMLLYAKAYGDLLYVLQNGSLLIVEENFETYEVQSDYCLDEGLEGLYAIVCIQSSHTKQVRMLRGEAVIYAVCLWLSVPCLLVTAFFYLKIDSLRELHGRSLSAHCTCLALAYALLGLVQIQLSIRATLTYFIQYFLLACICWLSALCCDICIKILYIYIKKVSLLNFDTEAIYFPAYAIASFGLPVLPVFYAMTQHKFGIPLYYIKGEHVNNFFTGDYFTIPSTILLLFCCVCLCITFYAFRRRQPKVPNENWNPEAVTEYEEFYKLKGTAKNVALLLAVVSICRFIEMITSHLNANIGADNADTISPFAIFDIFIALQGLFIFIIFVCSPTPLWMIKRWWISSGSLDVAGANSELGALTKDNASR